MPSVPANLFDRANIADPWPANFAWVRRLLVTAWLTGGDVAAARSAWAVDSSRLRRSGSVTVLTTLLQLQRLGFVRSVERSPSGDYDVVLAQEEAA